MVETRVERRLAAVLAADVSGYSRLMGADEEGTLAALKACRREITDPKIAEHRGRIVKTTGDGALVEFASAIDAVRCATEIQHTMAERNADIPEDRRIEFRIGINVGDIIIDEGDIYGDGVNIAARIEAIAEPGGISISEDAYRQIKGRLALDVSDMGEQRLKNIAQPVRVYCVRFDDAPTRPALALPDKPSIAVLPFQNMSGDPEQEYFADGMVEEIITTLSRFRQLFVIARNSTFTYKGRPVDVKQVGRELGVRYVLEGSVRRSGNRVRITGQLIDASTGAHLWADRFDGALEDIFDLQERVAATVAGEIAPRLERAEIERAKRKSGSLDAYDYYLRGMAIIPYAADRESTLEAQRLFNKAIECDQNFASAHAEVAYCYVWLRVNGYSPIGDQEIATTLQHVAKAAEWGRDDAAALALGGMALAFVGFDLDGAASLIDSALRLNPNLAAAWHWSGWVRFYLGDHERAIEHLAHAMRLSPLNSLFYGMQCATAYAYFFSGRYDDAASWADKACLAGPQFIGSWRIAAASHALGGNLGKARQALVRVLRVNPTDRVSMAKYRIPLRRPEDVARYEEGLRKAGLPE